MLAEICLFKATQVKELSVMTKPNFLSYVSKSSLPKQSVTV
jgi:hypothetical protein